MFKCLNSPDLFCCVCGEFTSNAHKEKMSTRILDAYYYYFGSYACQNMSKHWSLNFACFKCARYLRDW